MWRTLAKIFSISKTHKNQSFSKKTVKNLLETISRRLKKKGFSFFFSFFLELKFFPFFPKWNLPEILFWCVKLWRCFFSNFKIEAKNKNIKMNKAAGVRRILFLCLNYPRSLKSQRVCSKKANSMNMNKNWKPCLLGKLLLKQDLKFLVITILENSKKLTIYFLVELQISLITTKYFFENYPSKILV